MILNLESKNYHRTFELTIFLDFFRQKGDVGVSETGMQAPEKETEDDEKKEEEEKEEEKKEERSS